MLQCIPLLKMSLGTKRIRHFWTPQYSEESDIFGHHNIRSSKTFENLRPNIFWFAVYQQTHHFTPWEARWPIGRASDTGARGRGFDPHSGLRVVSSCRVVSLSKIHLPPKKY